ncbi:unnamed protein product [Vicia faba]|uniref:H/ACA ribonucleoprotein complex non-core subunit NAF1 n=1 Tax=Vicia faba TaxID=3906 RepID=A0AAV0Z2C5_VICFA|nr:unnamed protein product [Vicia faba]
MDDDDIALADSFINFELAASSPISDDPPDPFITESGSSDSDPPVGSSGIEERIGSFGLVEKEVDENESGGVRCGIVAIDDAVGMESEDSEVRDDVIATDDESRGDVIVNDDEIRGEIVANVYEIRGGIMGVDDAVGMERVGCEISGDVIANDDGNRGDVIANDDGNRGDVIVNDNEIKDEIVTNDDEIRGEIIGVDDAVGMESEDGEIRGEVIANDDEIRGEIVANDDVNATVTEGSNRENECSDSGIKIDEEYELEEGEIVESDNDRKVCSVDSDDEDSEERSVRFTNELEILPRVPPVNVKLGPHHILLPLGVVTSIVGARVIVEGSEKHDPLDQGSVLWITGRQTPLGVIDDTFAQVKNPHYIVRYNSEDEIPEGVHEGTLISFVAEFAEHVLNSKDLYKKGSDASGMYDEEVSDETEFSDDGQEAEYYRIQKQSKRGQSSQNSDRMKNDRQHLPLNDGSIPKRQMVAHGHGPPVPSSGQGFFGVGRGHSSPIPGTGQGFSGVGHGHSSPLPPLLALPHQPPVSHNWSSGFLTNNVAWYPENTQNFHQQPMKGIPFQQQPMKGIPFQQQFNPSHRFPPPTVYPGGQPNMYAEPMHAQGPMNQNQRTHFPQFQAPTYFQPANISGNLGGHPHQFNPPTYFHSPPIAGNQGGPQHQVSLPANFQSPPISGYQGGPPLQFNPPANFQSSPISANQNPPQFNQQFNPGAYDGRERTFAGHRRRPSHRGGKGWRPAK